MKKRSYVLVIDIGNTSTSAGLYAAEKVTRVHRIETPELTRSSFDRFIGEVAGTRDIEGVSIASVVPSINTVLRRKLKRRVAGPILEVNHTLNLGVKITYPRPETIGADRLANASAAVYRYRAPIIVADFGTALTFDVISHKDGYIGGVICPGLPLMFSYLADKTALLPHIKPGPVRHSVGKNTTEAMRIGARWGYRGMVREVLDHVGRNLGGGSYRICATGGFAAWVLKGLDIPVSYDKDLTLFGLGRIYSWNASKS